MPPATPLAGVGISGTGAGTFSGSTDSNGCADFADLPSGNYTLTPTAAGLVDKNGNPPESKTVGVIPSGTKTVSLQYDRPGAICRPIQIPGRQQFGIQTRLRRLGGRLQRGNDDREGILDP